MLDLINLFSQKIMIFKISFFIAALLFSLFTCYPYLSLSENYEPKSSVNGSGLKIPRMVSLKNSLTYMRSGPGKKYPIIFELNQKSYPLKIISEYNNWRKVISHTNITGWIHTQLLSSYKTGVIIKNTFLKKTPSSTANNSAKLLQNLVVNIKKCNVEWCKIEVIKTKHFVGWVKKIYIWGSTSK